MPKQQASSPPGTDSTLLNPMPAASPPSISPNGRAIFPQYPPTLTYRTHLLARGPSVQDDRADRETAMECGRTAENNEEGSGWARGMKQGREDREVQGAQCEGPLEAAEDRARPEGATETPIAVSRSTAGRHDLKRHRCCVCDKMFSRPSALTAHMSVHTGTRPHACPQAGCGRRFSVSSNMKRHLRSHGDHTEQAAVSADSSTGLEPAHIGQTPPSPYFTPPYPGPAPVASSLASMSTATTTLATPSSSQQPSPTRRHSGKSPYRAGPTFNPYIPSRRISYPEPSVQKEWTPEVLNSPFRYRAIPHSFTSRGNGAGSTIPAYGLLPSPYLSSSPFATYIETSPTSAALRPHTSVGEYRSDQDPTPAFPVQGGLDDPDSPFLASTPLLTTEPLPSHRPFLPPRWHLVSTDQVDYHRPRNTGGGSAEVAPPRKYWRVSPMTPHEAGE